MHDTNIYESFKNPNSDQLGRFFWEFNGKNQYKQIHTLIQIKGGLEGYRTDTIENRMANEINGSHAFPILKRLAGSINYRFRARTFFQCQRDYIYLNGSPVIQYQMSRKWRTNFNFSATSFYFKGNPDFNYDFSSARFSLNGMFDTLLLRLHLLAGAMTYNRNAIDFKRAENDYWLIKGISQKDRIFEAGIGFETYTWIFIQTNFYWRQNLSNSYGSSYNLYQIHFIFAKPFPWKTTCKLMGHLYFKSYKDALEELIQILPDTEMEENTYLIFDVAKEISDRYEIYLRTAWYRNESPFRNRYYEKFLFSIGCKLQFSNK